MWDEVDEQYYGAKQYMLDSMQHAENWFISSAGLFAQLHPWEGASPDRGEEIIAFLDTFDSRLEDVAIVMAQLQAQLRDTRDRFASG